MSQKQGKKESRLSKCLKSPIRILTRARDLYIKSITECSDRIGYGTGMVCPTGHLNTLPQSFSVSSAKSTTGDEDLRELIRAASTRSLGNKIQADLLQQQQGRQSTKTGPYIVLRSQSIGVGRIDEDKPCEFGEDINVQTTILPRSLSYAAVGKRKGTVL